MNKFSSIKLYVSYNYGGNSVQVLLLSLGLKILEKYDLILFNLNRISVNIVTNFKGGFFMKIKSTLFSLFLVLAFLIVPMKSSWAGGGSNLDVVETDSAAEDAVIGFF